MKFTLIWNDARGLLHEKAFRSYAQARAFKAKLLASGIAFVALHTPHGGLWS